MDDSEEQDFNSNTTVAADESHLWIVSTMKSRVLLYAETHQLNSQCWIFCAKATTSMPPPDCRAIRTKPQAPNPSRYAKHYQQGNARKQ